MDAASGGSWLPYRGRDGTEHAAAGGCRTTAVVDAANAGMGAGCRGRGDLCRGAGAGRDARDDTFASAKRRVARRSRGRGAAAQGRNAAAWAAYDGDTRPRPGASSGIGHDGVRASADTATGADDDCRERTAAA